MNKTYKIITVLIIMLFAFANAEVKDFQGRWAEKISERVVADIFPDKNNNEYKIFITWREDNLIQKDIYRFTAKKDKNGSIKYKNGLHIYRYYNPDKSYTDKIDYKDGKGSFELKNNELIWIDEKDKTNTSFILANKSLKKDSLIKNSLFSISIPQELKGFYKVRKRKGAILIYDKLSEKEGFGGFAFGLKAYLKQSDYANAFGVQKIGEITDKKGRLYDMVLIQPTDVQYNYTKKIPDSYDILYHLADYANIQGVNGSIYAKNKGMKGEDLYGEIIKKHIQAIKEKWNSTKLEKEDMSYMYNVLAQTHKNVFNKIGYAYKDINADGIEELLIGEIAEKNLKGVVYDIYTMVNRKPAHVVSGGARDRYFACDGSFVCREYSSGALENGLLTYVLINNSTELFPQVGFKYDGYENRKNPWFISYNFDKDEWENVSKKTFDDRIKVFKKYERFNFKPLNK